MNQLTVLTVVCFLLGLVRAQNKVMESKKYYVSTEQRTFMGAWIGCKTAGMRLASVESEQEQYAVNNATLSARYTSSDGYWIGGVTATDNTNDWYWVETGLRMMYENWGTYQPKYDYNIEENLCVRLGNFYKVNELYKWENANCFKRLYYVCEIES